MAREPSPVRPNQFARCPSPTFQKLRGELARRDASPNRQGVNPRVISPGVQRGRSVSPKPVRAVSPSGHRHVSPVRACASPTFQRLQQDLDQRSTSPRRDNVSMKVVQPERQRSVSPIITITNHGVPRWAWAPRRERRGCSPAGMVALQPNPNPREKRSQSPSFNELERQMVEKNAYPLGGGRSQSPTVRQFQRDLAGSPTITLAQHTRSSSPSVRSRPTERRIVRLSSPVPFKKESSPYRHVAPPIYGYNASYVGQMVCHVGRMFAVIGCGKKDSLLS